ncbi:NifU family protein [Streptomyces sp. NPDC058731]|uniref:NifU family protein n=1 Tax=Streptomyces sp. NPDC058731 TaxID=3346613 RepID=UPI0036B59F7B
MIPLHPQRVLDHPDRLRWIIPAGILTATGPIAEAPAQLAALVNDGTLAEITVEPAAVVTRLGKGRSWPQEGTRVRTALHSALAEPAGWVPAEQGHHPGDDALLEAVVRDLLTGPVSDFARSHGGTIDLVSVQDGIVTVRLGGACHGCPAAWITLHQRLERQLRRRYPGLREVRNATSSAPFTKEPDARRYA